MFYLLFDKTFGNKVFGQLTLFINKRMWLSEDQLYGLGS